MTLASRPDPFFYQQLFVGVFPGGIVYADRSQSERGDYKRLAFLPYGTLKLELKEDCPSGLRVEIEAHAATLQLRRGELFPISSSGRTVRLGSQLSQTKSTLL